MTLNKPVCAVRYGNTGYGECFLDPKKIVGAIQVPSDFIITESDLADFQNFLIDKTMAPIGQRIFPYHNFVAITDNTEDVQIETTDYGNKFVTRDGDYDLTFRYSAGGVLLHQEIQKNSGTSYLFYDEKGVLYGYKTKQGLKGIPDVLFVPLPWRMATGSTAAQYLLRFIFRPQYLNYGNLGFVAVTDFNLFDIKGLQDVTLTLVNLVGNVATIRPTTTISGVNLYEMYSTQLQQTSAWLFEDEVGVNVPVTGVAANSTEKAFDVTLSSVPFNAADKVYGHWAAPDVLAEAPISVSGYDVSQPLEIEAPGS